jgi:hypothetical protein
MRDVTIAVSERPTEVVVTLHVPRPPEAVRGVAVQIEAQITMAMPLGDRRLVDGASGEPRPFRSRDWWQRNAEAWSAGQLSERPPQDWPT